MCSTMRLIFNLYSTFNALFNIQLRIQHSTIHFIFNSLFTHSIIYSTISTIYSTFNFNFTLGTRGFSRVRREFSVLAEGRHIFGRRPKPRAAKPREKPLARSGAFYRPRWPLSFFIGLHLRQSDWKSPTVIMWAGTWRNVQRPTLSLERQVRV